MPTIVLNTAKAALRDSGSAALPVVLDAIRRPAAFGLYVDGLSPASQATTELGIPDFDELLYGRQLPTAEEAAKLSRYFAVAPEHFLG